MQQLLAGLHTWATDNKLHPTALETISHFTRHLFDIAGEKQPPIYFADIKKNLEKILALLNEEQIPLLRRKSQLAELAKNLEMCGPGLYRHIESVRQTLASPVSFSHWLAEHRTNLIYLFAEKHIAEQKIQEGNAIHAHNAFLLHAAKKGWAPLTRITEIKEHFLSTAKVTPEIYQRFETEFQAQYTLESIADFMTTAFAAEFNRQRKQMVGAIDSPSGWFPYDAQIDTLSKALLKNLDLTIEENFFDTEVKDNKAFIKLNSKRFKELFLKHCYEKGALIPSAAWSKESVFEGYDLIHPKDSYLANLVWIQDKTTGVVTPFDDLSPDEKERYYAYSLRHYQSPDRFHFTEPMPIVLYFPSKKSFQALVKQLEQDGALIVNATMFKELLRHNPLRLIDGLAVLKPETTEALLDAMEVDYALLSPHHPLHHEVLSLIDKAVNQDESDLAQLLGKRFRATEEKANAFKNKIKDEKGVLPILYSALLRQADKATEDDQFIYRIYLKHDFPAFSTSSLRPSEAFKKAHEQRVEGLPKRTQQLLSALKDGRLKELKDAKMTLKELRESWDKNWISLARWAFKTEQQAILNHYYQEASKTYPSHLSPESINLCQGLYQAPLLFWAVLCHQKEWIEVMSSMQELKMDTGCQDGDTPLHAAALIGDIEITQWLIEKGTSLNRVMTGGVTPLYIAAHNGHVDIVKYLVQQGANVNAARTNGFTPLNIAVHYGHVDIVKYLVQQGANVNAVRTNGLTALFSSVHNGHVDIVKYLVQQRANVNASMTNGATPLLIAAENGHVDIVKYLVQQGANVSAAMIDGVAPLFLAAQQNHVDIVNYLVQQRANVNAAKIDGATPLYIAVEKGHVNIVKFLVQQGVNVNAARTDGVTPLLKAVDQDHQPIVELLLARGANPFAAVENKTAYDWAKTPEIKKLILIAELKELVKSLQGKPSESKEKYGLFSQNPAELKAQQEALSSLLDALNKEASTTYLSDLLKKHPIFKNAPLKEYYEKVVSLSSAQATPGRRRHENGKQRIPGSLRLPGLHSRHRSSPGERSETGMDYNIDGFSVLRRNDNIFILSFFHDALCFLFV